MHVYALYDNQRLLLMRLSMMLVCGGLAVVPLTVAPTSIVAQARGVTPSASIAVPNTPSALAFPAIAVSRDPFVADAVAQPTTGVRAEADDGTDIGVVLPPNIGAEASDSAPAGVPLVRGIVLGQEPQALIDTGNGSVRVVGVGDAIGPERIRRIDATGVTLSSGLHLKIAGSQP
jgi:hypothetical protein